MLSASLTASTRVFPFRSVENTCECGKITALGCKTRISGSESTFTLKIRYNNQHLVHCGVFRSSLRPSVLLQGPAQTQLFCCSALPLAALTHLGSYPWCSCLGQWKAEHRRLFRHCLSQQITVGSRMPQTKSTYTCYTPERHVETSRHTCELCIPTIMERTRATQHLAAQLLMRSHPVHRLVQGCERRQQISHTTTNKWFGKSNAQIINHSSPQIRIRNLEIDSTVIMFRFAIFSGRGVFEKGDKPSVIISTLEALAVLLSLELFLGEIPPTCRTKILMTPTKTDNRGKGAALNKLMTTCDPASAVLTELAPFMKKILVKVQVEWSVRTGNTEADALANGVHDAFDPSLQCVVDPRRLSWELLPEALEAGNAAECEHSDAKAKGALPNRRKRQMKRKLEDRLRTTDPW